MYLWKKSSCCSRSNDSCWLEVTMKERKKFISDIDYNKSSKACSPCNLECKKIDKRVNNRKLSELSAKEVPHILKVFDL